MKRHSPIGKTLLSLFVIIIVFSSCQKDNFVDPPDPFEIQRLEEGYTSFEFIKGDNSFKILTNHENITVTEKGNYRIRGTIFADRGDAAPVRLSQGDFVLLKKLSTNQKTATIDGLGEIPISTGTFKTMNMEGGFDEFEGFGGYSEFTLPQVGLTQDLTIEQPDGTNILFGQGSDLPDDFPVNPDRNYFYFYYGDYVDFALGNSPFMIDRMALDPEDPFFYVHASAMSIPGLSSLEDGGFAASVQGNIQFTPPESLSFGKVESFGNGNLLLQGSVNLQTTFGVPIVISDATAVMAFDVDGSGDSGTAGANYFKGENVPFKMGLSGGLVLAVHDLASFELGDAAISLFVADYDQFEFRWAGWVTNELRPLAPVEDLLGWDTEGTAWDMIRLPGMVNELRTWGTIGTDSDNWEFGLHTTSTLKLGFMDVDMGGFKIEMSKNNLDLYAEMSVGWFGNLYFGGYIHDDGAYGLEGGARKSTSFGKWGLSIEVGYRVGFDLEGYASGDWDFCLHGKAYLDVSIGEAFFEAHPELREEYDLLEDDLKAEFSASLRACLDSSGKFKGKIRFSFWKIGYSFDFSFTLDSSEGCPAYNFEEIPLEEVPMENRFGTEVIVK